jgi:GT2 family glycosyltransferase
LIDQREQHSRLSLSAEAPARRTGVVAAWRVRVVIPYHNRPGDVRLLLQDLTNLGIEGVEVSVLLVDNASTDRVLPEALPRGLRVQTLRLERNTGGSGGFLSGMSSWLEAGVRGDAHELIWLLDSDVRLNPASLAPLIGALDRHPELAGVGSMLADPVTKEVFEGGGDVDPRTGELVQELPADWASRALIPVGYLAACSLLVRRTVVEAVGPFADLFISGDDVEWCCRVRRMTGLGFAAVPASVAYHPRPDKMRTWGRYYAARNATTVMGAAGVTGRLALTRRALREVGRAVCQVMVGRDDLAVLHLRGLRDSGMKGPAPAGVVAFEPWRPMSELEGAVGEAVRSERGRVLLRRDVLRDASALLKSLNALCIAPDLEPARRVEGRLAAAGRMVSSLIRGPRHGVAVVSARGRPGDWMAGRVIISVDEGAGGVGVGGGFCVRRVGRLDRAIRVVRVTAEGLWRAARLKVEAPRDAEVAVPGPGRRPALSIVVLSYNRWAALERTLRRLGDDPVARDADVIVVDNASTDGTPRKLTAAFSRVRVIALRQNVGVGAFNEGVKAATGEAVLLLDDDSWPADGVIERALDVLAHRPDVAAVSLLPVHPETKASEWPFAAGDRVSERWPVMGCGNLVRKTAWDRVGGYEGSFFLYRNDVDLALKLLGAGHRVVFDPSLVVWHDTPAGAGGRKSRRWFHLATRNWVWLCRRHGRGWKKWKGIAAGWAWAHRLAGMSFPSHAAVLRGAWTGLVGRRAGLPRATRAGGLGDLLRVRIG